MGHSLGSTKCWRFKRAPSLSRISFGFLYLLEMFKHLNILSGYPLDQLRSCWHLERAMVTMVLSTHSLLVAHMILRPAPHVHPFSLCQRGFFSPLEPFPLWDAKERARKRKFLADVKAGAALVSGVCAPCWAERDWGLLRTAALCPLHTQKTPPEPFPPTP